MDMNSIITILSLIIAGVSLFRGFNNDGKGATKDFTRVETKIDYMGGDVKDIRDEVKLVSIKQDDMATRLVKVEESTKSAHHRIDGMEEKIK